MKVFFRRLILTGMGVAVALCLATLLVGLFGLPAPLVRWMIGVEDGASAATPSYIVVLGGGGIPSESGLIRTYYGAQLGKRYRAAKLVVSLPADSDPAASSVGRMRDELVLRGIPKAAVLMEHKGRNTHEQAESIARMLGPAALKAPVLIVTSPEHVRRSLLCFRHEGFQQVSGVAAHSIGVKADLGQWTSVRYGFWSNECRLIEYMRELVAMLVYKLRGWI